MMKPSSARSADSQAGIHRTPEQTDLAQILSCQRGIHSETSLMGSDKQHSVQIMAHTMHCGPTL